MVISEWVGSKYGEILAGGRVLDLACGGGRHTLFLEEMGYEVTAVDIDVTSVRQLKLGKSEILEADLETGTWPFGVAEFDGIVVVNYLFRDHFPKLIDSLKSNGVLIFDTFALGNEKFGRPRSPDFLLKPGELKAAFQGLDILDFKEGYVDNPSPAIRQSIVARKP